MNDVKRKAEEFVSRWRGKGNEKQESQKFWLDLLGNVFEIPLPTEYIDFERPVMLDHTSFIDGYIKNDSKQRNISIYCATVSVTAEVDLQRCCRYHHW